MKKFLLILLVIIIAIPLLVVASINSLVKTGIEEYGSELAGAKIEVGSVDFSFTTAEVSVSGLKIWNPEGFSSAEALALDNISVRLDRNSLTTDTIVINEIEIDAPLIRYEVGAAGNNIDAITKNIKKNSGKKEGEENASSEPSKKVVIDALNINNGKLVLAAGSEGANLSIPDIKMKDLGRNSQSANTGEIVAVVMGKIMASVARLDINSLKSLTEGVLGGAAGEAEGVVKDATETLKGILP